MAENRAETSRRSTQRKQADCNCGNCGCCLSRPCDCLVESQHLSATECQYTADQNAGSIQPDIIAHATGHTFASALKTAHRRTCFSKSPNRSDSIEFKAGFYDSGWNKYCRVQCITLSGCTCAVLYVDAIPIPNGHHRF